MAGASICMHLPCTCSIKIQPPPATSQRLQGMKWKSVWHGTPIQHSGAKFIFLSPQPPHTKITESTTLVFSAQMESTTSQTKARFTCWEFHCVVVSNTVHSFNLRLEGATGKAADGLRTISIRIKLICSVSVFTMRLTNGEHPRVTSHAVTCQSWAYRWLGGQCYFHVMMVSFSAPICFWNNSELFTLIIKKKHMKCYFVSKSIHGYNNINTFNLHCCCVYSWAAHANIKQPCVPLRPKSQVMRCMWKDWAAIALRRQLQHWICSFRAAKFAVCETGLSVHACEITDTSQTQTAAYVTVALLCFALLWSSEWVILYRNSLTSLLLLLPSSTCRR